MDRLHSWGLFLPEMQLICRQDCASLIDGVCQTHSKATTMLNSLSSLFKSSSTVDIHKTSGKNELADFHKVAFEKSLGVIASHLKRD